MDIKKIKEIFGKIESISVDTQPLRNFLQLLQSKKISIDYYKPTLETLSIVLDTSKGFSELKATQVSSILSHLQGQLDNRENETIVTKTSKQSSTIEKDLIILSALVDIKKDLAMLKDKQPLKQYITQTTLPIVEDKKGISIDSVFVKPNMNTDNIKSNVSVDTKIESNILDKLSRLKQLKKGGIL